MPPRRALLAAAVVALGAPAAATELVFVHADGSPVARAEVSIVGRPGTVRTDDAGRASWTPDLTPPFEVLVALPGGRFGRPLLVEALPDAGPVHLEIAAAVEEAITVTAGLAPHIDAAPAAGTTLLTGREVEVRMPAHLTQALESVAGVSAVSEGQAAVPAVRGLAKGRTLLVVDGARVSAERRVGPSATFLDPAVLEAVEVARGPGFVAYGSDAFGGVINARTRRAVPGSGYGGRFSGTLGAGVPEQRAALELTRGTDSGGILLQGHYRSFDDYDSPEGEVFNSGARDFGGRARLDHGIGRGLLSVSWQSDFGRDIGRPRDNSGTVRFFYPSEDSHRLVASYEALSVGGFSRLGGSAFLGRYALVTDQDRFATAERPRSGERADVSASDYHVRTFAERPVGGARLHLGAEVNGRFDLEALDVGLFYDAAGEPSGTTVNVSVQDARRTDAGVFATLQGRVGRQLSLAGGLRGDRVTTRNRGGYFGDRDSSNGAVSGYASVTAGPFGGFSVTAQAARGFRDPVLSDRYFRGPTGRGFITGLPGLQSETSMQFDLALRYTGSGWRAAAYGYHYRIDDLIERYQTETDFFFFRNRGEARLRGMELEVQAMLPARLSLELAGHLEEGDALDDAAFLDDVPPPTATLRLTREFGRGFVQARGAVYAEDDRPGPTEQARDAYQLVDLAGGWRFAQDRLELRLLVRNLFDEAHLVSPDARATLAPGRSASLTATVAF
jgi:outer membrane receptor protein involved in Fe transport